MKRSGALRAALLLGACWTLPNSLLGLLAGLACLAWGARPQWRQRECALVFRRVPWPGPGGALTLGNVILHTGDELDTPCYTYAHRAGLDDEPRISLADHERAHVYQYMVLGPLFLPMYALCGGISARNRFERAADHYARHGAGWWPWRSRGDDAGCAQKVNRR
ncbi:hypothetical protein DVT68_03285 [Dyella solisilvae]|uniref:DUF4157 domain-containing protein n=1 Tax=Dyella solisilvae TaxID=1920168 RepID=A0A370KB30_9GAMM|nr:hypothetical protein [Dyella solisilvae]RDI99864.1 hypothetical protein DVT68_03285 [Dyella solisilvae]